VRETFKWLVAPVQTVNKHREVSSIDWEAFPLNPAAQAFGRELDRVVASAWLTATTAMTIAASPSANRSRR
jgi:hypothetical protein